MKPFVRFRRGGGAPKTFALQLLLTLLASSLAPLLLLSVFGGQTIRSQLQRSSDMSVEHAESNYINLYQQNIEKQVQSIDYELRKVENAVLVAKAMAEAVFSIHNHTAVEPVALQYDPFKRTFLDTGPDEQGKISIRSDTAAAKPPPELIYDLTKSRALFPLFQSETARNPNIVSMYYIHPQSGSYHFPVYDGPPDPVQRKINKLTTYSFYTDALLVPPEANQVVWTKPYFDITPRGWMFTATTPVYDENKTLKGVVAADVTITNFIGNVVDINFNGQDGYALLLDTGYNLIAAQQHGIAQINQMNLSAVFGNAGASRSLNYRRLELNGEQKAVFSRSISSTQWTLGYVISEKKLLEPVNAATRELSRQTERKLVVQLAWLSALAVFLSIGLAFFLRKRITKPVDALSDAFARMGEGKLTAKPSDTHVMEFDRLLDSFSQMANKIRELMEQQSRLNAELEWKVQQRTIELREMNAELELRVNELLRLEQWRKELFMNISHDLKTPITLIQGYIEAISDGTIPEQQTGIFLQRIYDGIQAITVFARNLNELSLLESRQIYADMAPLRAGGLFQATAVKWAPYMELENRPFHIEEMAEDNFIVGDAHLLGRLLDNLIENALKYTAAQLPVTFRSERSGDMILFSVIDSGPGIPQEAVPYVFTSFYRVDKSRNSNTPGSGLGLAIAKEIAGMHGGSISLQVRENAGCCFTLALPLMKEPEALIRPELPPAQ
ncbi:sensor histidine kinase [Paenibacillus protaetiae]|uniref:histidine kinase n=1 Tax=Paenibacillus protaetiae TaxID=2509456 RepID=A0A4P6EWD2_9BACL|nr:sensor histidine kinase [Paenibacillus protaetiae]QAY66915.1 HAMP domain-containing protein [Paenibacillus protaetiae]